MGIWRIKGTGFKHKSDMTSKYGTNILLLYAITNEKTVKFVQIDRLLSVSKTSPAEARYNNSGR